MLILWNSVTACSVFGKDKNVRSTCSVEGGRERAEIWKRRKGRITVFVSTYSTYVTLLEFDNVSETYQRIIFVLDNKSNNWWIHRKLASLRQKWFICIETESLSIFCIFFFRVRRHWSNVQQTKRKKDETGNYYNSVLVFDQKRLNFKRRLMEKNWFLRK